MIHVYRVYCNTNLAAGLSNVQLKEEIQEKERIKNTSRLESLVIKEIRINNKD